MAKRRDGSVKVMRGAKRSDEPRFPTEGACREFLVGLRWPDGYDCPSCGHTEPPRITARGYLHCRDCQGEISPTAGTLFERSRTPLRVWFQALWLLADPGRGPNARELQRTLGLGSYQTAWAWLHKLRRAAAGQLVLVASALVIAEIVWTLETFYRLPKPAVRDRVLAILNTPGLEVEDAELLLQAIVDYVDRNVDFADACNGAWSLARGVGTVYTFDRRHFSRLAGIAVRAPEDTGG
ncbi:MAG: transposase [Candidatus Latescibacteria bacterium]|nr:transposase [Candidatus Latescibacterota bacterium]